MAKPNYAYERRQRDLAKKQKQEAKRQKQQAANQGRTPDELVQNPATLDTPAGDTNA